MYISTKTIRDLELKYGEPEEVGFAYEMREDEFEFVLRSQKHGRAHDVTLFIIKDGRFVVIKKPMYPPGAYRAPSGGIAPGEAFEDGALREAREETGLILSLEEYLLRARVRFSHGDRRIDWTSHVFTSTDIGGSLQPIDTHEIAEVRLITIEEMMGSVREALLASGSTGLRYRSDLADAVIRAMAQRDLLPASSISNLI